MGAAIALAGCSSASPSWLFSVTVNNATASDTELVLHDVSDGGAVAFSDRPDRNVHSVDLEMLPTVWSDAGFDEDAPNAALSAQSADGRTVDNIIVELTAVRLEGGDLVFDVVWLDGVPSATALSAVVLVIDDTAGTYSPPECPAVEVVSFAAMELAQFDDSTMVYVSGIACTKDEAGAVLTAQLGGEGPQRADGMMTTTTNGAAWTCDWSQYIKVTEELKAQATRWITCSDDAGATIKIQGGEEEEATF